MPSPPFRLHALLDIRRNAEAEQKRAFGQASAHRVAMENQLGVLENQVRQAQEAVAAECAAERTRPLPTRVEEGLFQARYLDRLRRAAQAAQQAARDFRAHELAQAIAAEDRARAGYTEARQAHEAIVKIRDRDQALKRKQAEDRAEDAASDLAQAAFARKVDDRS